MAFDPAKYDKLLPKEVAPVQPDITLRELVRSYLMPLKESLRDELSGFPVDHERSNFTRGRLAQIEELVYFTQERKNK